ncbi:hypothetical protein Desgi_2969 [Desulfoscipio gibsoniae DSM 7213]|uniref:Uncharacterized protein n=1 Tax=Desulfoscipio gibsoniae DSM 7213 TaxID=767817 RepID=R4KRX8_9FIRM|nr:hypothetical protein Desgi_2969 [Desulfoscipio gibsoniae DSM 7213]
MGKFRRLWQKFFSSGLEVGEIEKRLFTLEERLRLLEDQCGQDRDGSESPPVIVERLCIDKLIVDKVELNNNIGSVEIKELGGALNIGANYGWGFSPPGNGPGEKSMYQSGNSEVKKRPAKGAEREQVARSNKKEKKRGSGTPDSEHEWKGESGSSHREDGTCRWESFPPAEPGNKKYPPHGAGPKYNIIFKELKTETRK